MMLKPKTEKTPAGIGAQFESRKMVAM